MLIFVLSLHFFINSGLPVIFPKTKISEEYNASEFLASSFSTATGPR